MNPFTRSLAVLLTAAAMGAPSGATASAAPLAQTDDTGSIERVLVYHDTLEALRSAELPGFTCPSEHPWLQNAVLDPRRIVPPGVEVDASSDSIAVSIGGSESSDSEDRVTGWDKEVNSATNWDPTTQSFEIYAHCTNDPSQAFSTSPDQG